MCGIAGIFSLTGDRVDHEALQRMAQAQTHRGPDEHGCWCHADMGLAHRRLAVIDLQQGRQPMRNAAGTTWICYNGEIYNHARLRRQLQADGAQFHSRCDTEVLIHLYDRYGSAMLPRLEGMFAFAIFDLQRGRLLLARDRLGQKPLFYFVANNCLAFASELQALAKAPGFPAELSLQAVHDYLSFQYVPGPRTIYSGVHKLPPAQMLIVERNQHQALKPKTYWQPSYVPKSTLSFADAAVELRRRLQLAVEKRLIADVPLGAFLSGGIDSTIIVGMMQQTLSQPVKTFTIGFADARYDERQYASAAAAFHGTEHQQRVVEPCDLNVVRKLVRHYGEPFADASMLPTYLLSAYTREHVTVALSGDGADELFGGYNRYLVMNQARFADLLPLAMRRKTLLLLQRLLPGSSEERSFGGRLQRLLTIAAAPAEERYLSVINRFDESRKHSVYGPRMRQQRLRPCGELMRHYFHQTTTATLAEQPAEVDLHTYLVDDILTKVDIASMANSLEVRSPFLDHDVVEFAAQLPWHFKQRGFSRKRLLRAACADLLPPALARRPKMGFGVPLAHWFRNQWQAELRSILLDPAVARRGLFAPTAIAELIDQHCQGSADHSYCLWTLLVFELWCQEQQQL